MYGDCREGIQMCQKILKIKNRADSNYSSGGNKQSREGALPLVPRKGTLWKAEEENILID